MVTFLAKVGLYLFILMNVTGDWMILTMVTLSVVALEFFSYAKGMEEGLAIQLEKVKHGD